MENIIKYSQKSYYEASCIKCGKPSIVYSHQIQETNQDGSRSPVYHATMVTCISCKDSFIVPDLESLIELKDRV